MVTRRRDARVGHLGAAWACACAARMGQDKASGRSPRKAGRRPSTSLRARVRARFVVHARGRVEPGTRAHGGWGRAGRKRSEGAGEVEREPPSGTEREGGASASPELTAPALFPQRPAGPPPPSGRGPRGGKEESGAEDGGRGRLGPPAGREALQ